MRSFALLSALSALTALAGCSGQGVLQRFAGPVPGVSGPEELDALARAGAPQMIVRMPDRGIASTLRLAETRNGVQAWRALDNVQIYIRDGIIIGTRGLGNDLMTADTGPAADLIRRGQAGRITRIHRMLDGEDRLEIRSWICDITPVGPEPVRTGEDSHVTALRVDETCHSPRGGLTNRHWVLNGAILQSEQVFSQNPGRILVLFLP